MESVWLKQEGVLARTKSKNDIHSGDPRCWQNPEEKKKYRLLSDCCVLQRRPTRVYLDNGNRLTWL